MDCEALITTVALIGCSSIFAGWQRPNNTIYCSQATTTLTIFFSLSTKLFIVDVIYCSWVIVLEYCLHIMMTSD